MSFILQRVRPANIQAWIAVNAAGSLKNTATESWRAYLAANSGTGASISSLEKSFLSAAGSTQPTLHDAWGTYNSAQSGSQTNEKCRSKYK